MDLSSEDKKKIRILEIDPWLKPYEKDIHLRMERFSAVKKALLGSLPSLSAFANGYMYFGFHRTENGWYYREWAPAAEALYLLGDFNGWNPHSHPLQRLEHGCWEIFLPVADTLPHLSRVKVRVKAHGLERDRIPAYIRRIVQDPVTHGFDGQIWQPDTPYRWTDSSFRVNTAQPPLIYESHIGMAQEKEAMGTYTEFTRNILPRVKEGGYNAIQLMAIMEHPYYASFGYQVSSFFAASAWFGTPEELKELIDTAHAMGIAVLLDIVHSHAVKNVTEGLNYFDGTDYQYFHTGPKGDHPAWDSKLFNYGKPEVLHFLLSNVKYWLEEYHFDGFRFDGVTSMLYHHHGLGVDFCDYGKYFSMDTDLDAVTYLQLANRLIREVRPDAVTVAEDMSGMPGMCLPVEDGGIGFDYRLSMGVPDFWIRMLKDRADENWHMGQLWHELTTRRPQERNIGYAESHDQALVGDKTLMFRLADQEMYWSMAKDRSSLIIQRAVELHKLIRFITLTLAGEGYLNFMGNEFGHPEWIDFPREGNGWSFKYARRQWSLADNGFLRYEQLYRFDREMLAFVKDHSVLGAADLQNLWLDEEYKLLAYRKGGLIFLFNFHPVRSFPQFALPTGAAGKYRVVFSSDDGCFGGLSRISKEVIYQTQRLPRHADMEGILVYSPSRTAMVLEKVGE